MTQTKQEDFIPFKVNEFITIIGKGSKIAYGWNEGDWYVFQILNNKITIYVDCPGQIVQKGSRV